MGPHHGRCAGDRKPYRHGRGDPLDRRQPVAPANARRYLLDLENFSQLSDRVRESRVLGITPDGRTRVKLAFENCVLIFCKTTRRIATVEVLQNLVVMRTEPAESDFHFGHERWQAQGDDEHTIIEYAGDFIPKFWIPPLIDTWIIKQYAESEITKTGAKIEELSRDDAVELP
jgi:hypothetical protein